MAIIKVEHYGAAGSGVVVLSIPDEDGDYGWLCSCDVQSESWQPIADAIADAEVHLDHRCRKRR
jgi:hypothetical protein